MLIANVGCKGRRTENLLGWGLSHSCFVTRNATIQGPQAKKKDDNLESGREEKTKPDPKKSANYKPTSASLLL